MNTPSMIVGPTTILFLTIDGQKVENSFNIFKAMYLWLILNKYIKWVKHLQCLWRAHHYTFIAPCWQVSGLWSCQKSCNQDSIWPSSGGIVINKCLNCDYLSLLSITRVSDTCSIYGMLSIMLLQSHVGRILVSDHVYKSQIQTSIWLSSGKHASI